MQRQVWQRSLALALMVGLCLTVIGCGGGGFAGSKITKANAEKIKEGMSEQEVTDILGPADITRDNNAEMTGRPGNAAGGSTPKGKGQWTYLWKQGDKTITVFFDNGKVTKVSKGGFD